MCRKARSTANLGAGVEGVLESLHVVRGHVLEQDGVGALGDGVASVVLAGDDGGEGHAGRGDTLDQDIWDKLLVIAA